MNLARILRNHSAFKYCVMQRKREGRWRRGKGTGSSQGLSPSKFKIGVRDKSLTPVNSPLILIPITATIRTRQVFFVITVLFFNIVLCKGKGRVGGDRGIWCRRVFSYHRASLNVVFCEERE